MPTDGNVLWQSLEKWDAIVFLVAGVLLLVATINEGLIWAANMEMPELLEFAGFLGMFISYLGLLGLYPRLAGRTSELARVGLGLLLLPVAVILIEVIFMAVGVGPQFGRTIALGAFGLFALGVALFGGIFFRIEVLPETIGGFLVIYAIGWIVLLGGVLLYGAPPPGGVIVIATGFMAVALLAIGYILQTEISPGDRSESAFDSAS